MDQAQIVSHNLIQFFLDLLLIFLEKIDIFLFIINWNNNRNFINLNYLNFLFFNSILQVPLFLLFWFRSIILNLYKTFNI